MSVLDDDRLTTAGLFFEAHAGLLSTLQRRLLADCGLSVQAFDVLVRLARSPGQRLRMSDLARQTVLTPSGLTRAVDRLERDGLVERASCPTDRRGAFAVLTAQGGTAMEAALPAHLEHLQESFIGLLEPVELAAMTAALRKLRDQLKPGADRASG